MAQLNALILEDVENDALLMVRELKRHGFDVSWKRVQDGETFRASLDEQIWDVVLADYNLPDYSATEALVVFKECGIDIPFIVISGTVGEDIAVKTIKLGSHDYIMKDALLRLGPAVEREIDNAKVRRGHRESQREVEKNERQLRTLFEHSPDAMGIVDMQTGCFVDVNQRATQLIGLDRDAMLQIGPIDVSPNHQPDGRNSRQALSEWQEQALQGRDPMFEWTHINNDGEFIPCEVRMTILPDPDRTLMLGSVRDISARKEAEESLRQSESRFQQIAENVNVVFFIMAVDWSELVYCSPAFDSIWGISRDTIYQNPMSLIETIHSDDRDMLRDRIQRRARGEIRGHTDVDFRIIRSDGQIRWIRTRVSPVHDADGGVYRVAGTATDVTEMKTTEQALRLKQFSVDEAAEAMFTVAPNGQILDANRTACERLEYTRDELLMMRIAQIDPHYPDELWPAHWEELRREKKMTIETQHQSKSGKIFDVVVSIAYFEFQGHEYCCSSIRDITKQKQSQNLLRIQHEVLTQITTATPLAETLNTLCQLIEQMVAGSVASVMVLDEAEGCLNVVAAPSLSQECIAALDGIVPGDEAGSCGSAAFLKRPVIVQDTLASPHWAHMHDFVQRFGVYACWSIPIFDERGGVLGTFAISHRRPADATSFHNHVLQTASHLAGIAIQRHRYEEQLRFTQLSVDLSRTAIFWVRPDAQFVYVNDAACESLGYTREELLTKSVPQISPDVTPNDWPKMVEQLEGEGFFFRSKLAIGARMAPCFRLKLYQRRLKSTVKISTSRLFTISRNGGWLKPSCG